MPNRILRDCTDSEPVNALTPQAERTFYRLIMKADDFGRLPASTKILRPLIYPLLLEAVREADLQRWISECETAGLVRLYTHDGKRYMEIRKFDQRTRAKFSKFPSPPDEPLTVNCQSDDSHMLTETRTKAKANGCTEPQVAAAVLLTFPCTGEPPQWVLTTEHASRLSKAFPAVDVESESVKALEWCYANKPKQKTARGMSRFLYGWMERSQNRGGSRSFSRIPDVPPMPPTVASDDEIEAMMEAK